MAFPDNQGGGESSAGERQSVAGGMAPGADWDAADSGEVRRRYPLWPLRVIDQARALKDGAPAGRQRALEDLWLLIHGALLAGLAAAAAGRPYFVDPEVRRDIASDKALALLRRLEDGSWDPAASGPGQLCSFLNTVARNGLADYERTSAAERRRSEKIQEARVGRDPWRQQETDAAQPDNAVWGERFARGLLECLQGLTARARRIWFLKVFYELGSREVGRHPTLKMKQGAVDVAFSRGRYQVQECLAARGYDAGPFPVGTFAAVWNHLRTELDTEV